MMRNIALAAGLIASASAELIESSALIAPRYDPAYRRPHNRKTGKRYSPNGKSECARRRAQIASGKLTAANGVAL